MMDWSFGTMFFHSRVLADGPQAILESDGESPSIALVLELEEAYVRWYASGGARRRLSPEMNHWLAG